MKRQNPPKKVKSPATERPVSKVSYDRRVVSLRVDKSIVERVRKHIVSIERKEYSSPSSTASHLLEMMCELMEKEGKSPEEYIDALKRRQKIPALKRSLITRIKQLF